MKKILLLALTLCTLCANAQVKKEHFSFAVKGGVNHFYDNAPKGFNDYPFNFTGGIDFEYSMNRILGIGAEYLYLDRERDIVNTAKLDAENHDITGFLTFNVCNLFAPKRDGHIWNLYIKGGAGVSIFHYKNEYNGAQVRGGSSSKHALVVPVGLVSEWNVTRSFAVMLEGQYRWYNKGDMSGFGVDCNSSKAWVGMLGIRYKFGANKRNHVKNGRPYETLQVVENPVPVVAPTPAPAPKPAPKPEPKPAPVVKPAPKPEPKPVITQEEKKVIVEAFEDLEFDTNKATIKAVSYPSLDKLAALLVKYPNASAKLSGYTDSTGRKEYNVDLSQRRADSVKQYLIGKGVNASNITAVGYGPENPIATNTTAAGRAKNRRVEIDVQQR